METTNQTTFTKINEAFRKLFSSKKITSTRKIYFAYILGWQSNGLTLTATNSYIKQKN
jgi:hypothetical protein